MNRIAIAAALVLAATAGARADGDAAAGKTSAKVCMTCHNLTKGSTNRIGPVLYGVVGRQPGTYPAFSYSPAMVAFGKQNPAWTPQLLGTFLHNPRQAVPGTKMTFAGFSDDKDVANVVAYLQSLQPDH